jgi:hypothetical protein
LHLFNSSPSTPISTAGLSWYIHNSANIISTKFSKKNSSGTDCWEMLILQQFIHSWLCYELVKVLYVFGLQPQIKSDISDWSQELHTAFDYFNNKQNEEHKVLALKVLDTPLTKPSIPATSKNQFWEYTKTQTHEESHIVLGYINVVAATTTKLL